MSKISCFNNTKLEEVFNNSKITEKFEENAAAKTIKAEYDSILAELNAIKQELELPLETSTITVSEIKFDTVKDTSALAKEYTNRITAIKEANPQDYWSVDIPSQETIKKAAQDGRIVKNNGGMAIVTEDGNLVGLFKDKEVKGVAKDLQEKRVALGGIKMDNFDGYLTKLYQKNGFRVVSRVPFNEEYSKDLKGYDKKLHGTPDVVAMIYDPQNKLKIEEKTFTDYNEAMAYRDSFVDEARALKSGKQNTEFFEGKAKEASSNIPYKPVLYVDQTTPVAKAYALYTAGGNFTGHISKMIAGFQEKQKQVAEAIVKGGFKSFLDIGTSEGGMIKTVASQNKDIVAVGVDPNLEMQKNFNSTPKVNNAEYRLEAFQGSWTENDGTEIKEFKTDKKFDVVNEDFAFQFINNNRAKQVKGVKELMTPNGIFVTSEKFHTANEAANELKKYDHQRKYFSPDQLTEDKQTIVSGMADDMVGDIEYVKVLKDNFKFVEEFWNSGNFKGYLASDSNKTLQEFKKNVGDLTSEFTDSGSQTKFQIIGEQGASKVEQYQQSLNKAKDFEKRGLTPQQIERQTGWYKFKGQWRTISSEVVKSFEIRNNTKDKVLTLKEVLDEGNKVFEFYPELNNIKVVFVGKGIQGMEMPEGFENGYGAYDEASRTILINTLSQGITVGDKEQKYTLAHELQHAIQELEQNPRGGNKTSILDEAMGLLSIESERLGDIYNDILKADKSKLTANEKLIVDASLQTIIAIDGEDRKTLNNQYKHLLGEIDANVVESVLKIKDNQNVIATSYDEMLSNYAQFFNIDLNNVFLLRNGNVRFSISPQEFNKTETLEKLKQTGLADNVYELSSQEIEAKLVELGVDANIAKQVVAYHGSPYSFDRFTTAAMGTGEGAQAFGWGLYFTDLKSIAENYAVNLSNAKRGFIVNGEQVSHSDLTPKEYEALEDIIKYGNNGALDIATRMYSSYKTPRNLEILQATQKYSNSKVEKVKNRNLYKVSLHKGKTPSEYNWLEWDKPVDKSKIDRLIKLEEDEKLLSFSVLSVAENGKQINGDQLYNGLVKRINDNAKYANANPQREVSLLLLRAGIDGIKYPAESISRGATSDTARGFNYVVFDENAVTIEEQIQFQKDGINLITNGFIHNNNVYLNKNADESVFLHEFNHLYQNWLKENRPEVYKNGLNLIQDELNNKNSDIKDIIDFVKLNQPNLTEEALYEEILTELTGRKGLELLLAQKESKSGILNWISEAWQAIKDMLGLSSYTDARILNMNLKDFANASAIDLLRGQKLNLNKNGNKQLSQTEEQGRTKAGRIAIEATNILRGGEGTSKKSDSRSEQIDKLRIWSYDNGYYIEDYEKLGDFIFKGMESQVYYNSDSNSVFKVNDLEFYDTPLDYLDAIAVHNQLFPEAPLVVKGFTTRQDTFNFAVIVEQPFVEAERGATQEEVKEELSKMGYSYVEDNTYTNGRYTIEDLHEGNILVSKQGSLIFIDPVIRINDVQKQQITEPSATFNGFNTYSQAVKNTPINDVIKIDINGINVAEVTNNGDINDLIRQDIILDERELTPSGDIIFKTYGNSLAKKLVNAEIAREIIKGRVNEEGNIIAREKVELTKVSDDFNKNKKEFGQEIALTILATQIIENNTPVFGNNRIIDYSVEVPSDNILMTKLKNLLQELGIKTMSFETWAESYKKRVGELPTSNALSDIANKVIAFANGEITQDNLSEEVMHFVVEALPQEQIQPLLDMIHKTDEWKQYAAQYTEIYKDDNTVRREILGKVLKNYIQNQQEQTTLQGQSITRRLVELLDKFFTQIRELFKPQHQVQLDKFKEEIFQKLMAEELYSELSPEQFDGNKAIMFQTPQSPLYASLSKAVDTFKGLDKSTGGNYQYQLNEIELREFDELNQLKAASGLANTIKSYITHLNKRGKQKGFLSIEETFVYNTAEKDLRPVLNMVATVLKDNASPSPMQKRVLDEIQESLTSLDELSGNLTREKQEKFKELVEKTAKEVGLTDSMKEILVKEMETLDRDTNQFYSIYGGLAHAQNPILNMLGTTMSGMNREANLQFTQRQNSLLNVANALEFKDEQLAEILKKFKDGAYFLSPYDFEKLFLEEAKIKSSIYNTISGNTVTAEELVKTEEELKLKLSQDQLKDYLFQTTEAIYKSGLYIDVLKKEERTKIENLTEGFSAKTKNHLNNLASRKRKIFKRAQDNGGLSSEDNYELQTIMHDQQKLASPYDSEGNLFKGLALDDENDVTLANGVTKEDLDEEIRTAYELNYYNQKRREDFSDEKSKAPMRFIEEFNRIKDEKGLDKAIEFLKLNSRISYNNNFWSTFDKTNGIIEKLKENDATDLAEEIQRKRIKLKNILKQHRMYNNPSQINFDEMSGTAIADVKDIVTALNSMYKEAKLILPEEIEEYTESLSETVVNEAYKNQVRDRGLDTLDQQLDFIYQHTTLDDKEIIQRNIINYKRFKNGDTTNLPKAFTRFDAKSEEENIREYAESKLLPYFKELKPQDLNVQEFVENIAKAQTAEEWNRVVEEANYVSISPAYIWLDAETSDRLNPEYNKRRENNEPLVNLNYQNGILKNAKYQEYFGMSNGIATKNEKEFALLQEVLKFQENTIASAGMEGKHNKYQLPQFRRQSMARIAQLAGNLSAKNIKEAIKDIVTIREDDPILGQTIDGQDAKNFQRGALAVPRMGFRKLETSEEVTDEVLYSVMLMAKEAEQRKQRIAALIDIESIRTELQGKQFGDKSGESTTTYKMFDDFVRYNIYGQTESFKWETDFFGLASKKQNIAPIVRQFQNWVRLVNLGFSVLTPMTSLFQGTTNFFIERFVGDRIDRDAARQARKKMPKLMTEAASEFLNVRAKGELNLMLQYFGLESPMERYMNSNYGKAVRGTAISKSAYLTHYMGDLPLTAQTVMTVLYDFKNVKGELINYSEWRNRNRSLLEKDARATWAKEEKTAYSYLETVNGEMKMKDSFFTEIKDAKERLTFLKNRIATAKQEIDNQISQEDKGFIQRHSVFSFISLHKGFLISSVTKRMKSRHLNLYTGQMEEGTYAGAANFLVGILKDAKKKGLKQAWLNQYKEFDGGYKKVDKNGKFYLLKIDSGKEQIIGEYDSQTKRDEIYSNVVGQASRMRQVSIKRVMSDVLVANTLALVALLLKNLADDDDDNYGNEFLSYSVFRLATEVSSQSVGLPAQGYQFLQSPSSGISQIQNALDIFDLVNDDKVTQGSYAGLNRRQAWVFKSLPLMKEAFKVYNIDRTRTTYTHFNDVYLNNFTFVGMIVGDKKE